MPECRALLPITMLLPGMVAASGGHYGVDDATVVDAGRCQVEAWYARSGPRVDDVTAVPACNSAGLLEISLGLTRHRDHGDRNTIIELALKTLFAEVAPGSIGWGLAAATTWGGALERREGVAVYVPASYQTHGDVTFHANLGWSVERDEPNAVIWGVAVNQPIAARLGLIAEVYGTHRGDTELQAGARYEKGRATVDFGYGRGSGDDWFTVGVGWSF